MVQPVLLWFRDDLRLTDNPALVRAVESGAPVLPLYVLDDESPGIRSLGGASRWWLHHSLAALSKELASRGATLLLRHGPAERIVLDLAQHIGAQAVVWNRRYEKPAIDLDSRTKAELVARGIRAESSNAALLNEPWEVKGKTGDPLRVFSPYWRAALARGEPPAPLPAPAAIRGLPVNGLEGVELGSLGLLPTKPDWSAGFGPVWTPGEAGARERLATFLDRELKGYAEDRDRPDLDKTSRLSPHLRFGEIGARQIWHAVEGSAAVGTSRGTAKDRQKFLAELGWREFSYHLLFHFPDLGTANFQPRFDAFPWATDSASLTAWQRGRTGYPIVDAGMRQLWQTGWMHNRVRMIVASLLVKHLLIHWREGEDWFWDTLVDADPANNAASWQWVAGSGADAAPYFRIFNPILQGERFDPEGDYVRRFVPELARLPANVIHKPWTAEPAVLARAGVTLGRDYPRPIVDHDAARARALDAFGTLKSPDAAA
jgi:deoxyribodipyrimidine photo-lyase